MEVGAHHQKFACVHKPFESASLSQVYPERQSKATNTGQEETLRRNVDIHRRIGIQRHRTYTPAHSVLINEETERRRVVVAPA